MGTECYDRPPPAPYSFRGGLLWSFRELAKFSMPIRPAKPNPKNMPETTSFRTSGKRSASTRGLLRIIRRNVAPISAATKPVARLVFFMHSPRARIPASNQCDRKPGSFPPSLLVQVECDRRGKPDRVNVSAVPPSSNIPQTSVSGCRCRDAHVLSPCERPRVNHQAGTVKTIDCGVFVPRL